MSSFMCSDQHLAALAWFAVHSRLCGDPMDFAKPEELYQRTYQTLADENVKSLRVHYPNDWQFMVGDVAPFKEPEVKTFSMVAVIKSAHCYRYQACEHSEWELSPASKLIARVIEYAIRRIPGYDAAPWGAP